VIWIFDATEGLLPQKEERCKDMAIEEINFEELREWDAQHCLRGVLTAQEALRATQCAVRTDEHFIYYSDGTKLLDMMNGNYSCGTGLRHSKIIEGIKEACDSFGYLGEDTLTKYKVGASRLLLEDILGPDDWAGALRWVTSGSEAVEMALQIARLYTDRPNIISREWSYHGWTLGAGSCTRLRMEVLAPVDSSWIRDALGSAGGSVLVPGHNCFRCSLGHTYPKCKMSDGTLPCIHIVETMIRSIGVDAVAAIITEVFYGVSGIEPAPEYFPQLRKLTKDLGILWIDDEILVGVGRLGKWFAYQIYGQGATPDIMTVGKSINSSHLPVGGVVVNKEIAEFFGRHRWSSGGTMFAHPLLMASVEANLKYMIEEDVVGNAARAGERFARKLGEIKDRHKCVGQVAGRGCFWVLELVKDKQTNEPFVKLDRAHEQGRPPITQWPSFKVSMKAAEKGVKLAPISPNAVHIMASCTITEDLVDMACDAIDHGLTAVDDMCD
jgi:taurine---2-oxoglutarate transaminase